MVGKSFRNGLAGLAVGLSAFSTNATAERVYVGTYTSGTSQGIYLLDFDPSTGALENKGLAAEMENPSFLALNDAKGVLYAVGELPGEGGRLSVLWIEPDTGHLVTVGSQWSGGGAPCHVAVAPDGRHAVVANYLGGNVAIFPVEETGAIAAATGLTQHQGTGPNKLRQKGPHAHGVTFGPTGKRLYVTDLGADAIFAYDYDAEGGVILPADAPKTAAAPGAGPRHIVFHPNGAYAFVVNELDNTVTAYAYDATSGALNLLQSISTLPASFHGDNTTAELAVHPNGRFLYASNRGHNSIATFAVNSESGALAFQGATPSGGEMPRFFGIHSSGQFLLAANQQSGNVVVFSIDAETGALAPTGIEAQVDAPVCLLFTGSGTTTPQVK